METTLKASLASKRRQQAQVVAHTEEESVAAVGGKCGAAPREWPVGTDVGTAGGEGVEEESAEEKAFAALNMRRRTAFVGEVGAAGSVGPATVPEHGIRTRGSFARAYAEQVAVHAAMLISAPPAHIPTRAQQIAAAALAVDRSSSRQSSASHSSARAY